MKSYRLNNSHIVVDNRSSESMFSRKVTHTDALKGLLVSPESSSASTLLDLSFDAENRVLIVNWQGELSSEDIRAGYDLVMEQVQSYKPQKLLLDFQKRLMIRRKDQRWVFSTIFPHILRTVGDNVFVAIVLPVSLYYGLVGEMNGDELMHENNFLIIHHALYREEAYRWLNTMCLSNAGH